MSACNVCGQQDALASLMARLALCKPCIGALVGHPIGVDRDAAAERVATHRAQEALLVQRFEVEWEKASEKTHNTILTAAANHFTYIYDPAINDFRVLTKEESEDRLIASASASYYRTSEADIAAELSSVTKAARDAYDYRIEKLREADDELRGIDDYLAYIGPGHKVPEQTTMYQRWWSGENVEMTGARPFPPHLLRAMTAENYRAINGRAIGPKLVGYLRDSADSFFRGGEWKIDVPTTYAMTREKAANDMYDVIRRHTHDTDSWAVWFQPGNEDTYKLQTDRVFKVPSLIYNNNNYAVVSSRGTHSALKEKGMFNNPNALAVGTEYGRQARDMFMALAVRAFYRDKGKHAAPAAAATADDEDDAADEDPDETVPYMKDGDGHFVKYGDRLPDTTEYDDPGVWWPVAEDVIGGHDGDLTADKEDENVRLMALAKIIPVGGFGLYMYLRRAGVLDTSIFQGLSRRAIDTIEDNYDLLARRWGSHTLYAADMFMTFYAYAVANKRAPKRRAPPSSSSSSSAASSSSSAVAAAAGGSDAQVSLRPGFEVEPVARTLVQIGGIGPVAVRRLRGATVHDLLAVGDSYAAVRAFLEPAYAGRDPDLENATRNARAWTAANRAHVTAWLDAHPLVRLPRAGLPSGQIQDVPGINPNKSATLAALRRRGIKTLADMVRAPDTVRTVLADGKYKPDDIKRVDDYLRA